MKAKIQIIVLVLGIILVIGILFFGLGPAEAQISAGYQGMIDSGTTLNGINNECINFIN